MYRWPLDGRSDKLNRPGETEAGSAGTQPCRGITRWAHRDDEVGSVRASLRAPLPTRHPLHRTIDPSCLENPRPEGAAVSRDEQSAAVYPGLNQAAIKPWGCQIHPQIVL